MGLETQSIIQEYIRPFCTPLSDKSVQNLKILIEEARSVMSEREFDAHSEQWRVLGRKLNTNDRLTYLQQQNCRILLVELIREDAMHIFNLSYLNRAKIDHQYIRYLKHLGPYLFIEVIMVVSKLKTIHKHFYHKLRKNISENHITLKILKILELCNQKKRSINNNKAKFLCIVEDQADCLEITKELGKMLRESWKLEKSKGHIPELQQSDPLQHACQKGEEPIAASLIVKQMVKQPFEAFQEEYNFDLSDQLLNFDNLPQHTYRYSDTSDMLIG